VERRMSPEAAVTYPERAAIEQLLGDFAWHADRGEGVLLAGLFMPDGILVVGGQELHGRERIAEDCHRRGIGSTRKTRHVWSNLRIGRREADTLETTAIQLTIEQTDPSVPDAQVRVNDLFDTLRQDPHGAWRFARRIISREMALRIGK
jgi:SnoaL-like domain